jgi:hypothetical protein
MLNVITVLLFIALVMNIPTAIANFIGVNLQIEDSSCKEEVKNVKMNRLVLKIIQLLNCLIFLIVFILIQLL